MRVTRLQDHIYLIDVQTGGLGDFFASYVLRGKRVAVIETGPASSVSNLLSGLKDIGVKFEDVAYVAVTHIHLDHGGGVGTLLTSLPDAKVIVHPSAAPHLVNPQRLWQQAREVQGKAITDLYNEPEPVPPERIVAVKDGMTFDLGDGVGLRVVETLGHASHHQSYYETLGRGVFSGDAAGIYLRQMGVVVPTTPPPFRFDIARASLEKLIGLNPKALCYSHFGMATDAVGKLRAYLKQLRLWVSIADEGLRNKQGFGVIRSNIVDSDESVRKVLQFIKVHPILGQTVLDNSVWGVIKFVEKYGGISA